MTSPADRRTKIIVWILVVAMVVTLSAFAIASILN
jgi:flagellar basal body-associated protein FliL